MRAFACPVCERKLIMINAVPYADDPLTLILERDQRCRAEK